MASIRPWWVALLGLLLVTPMASACCCAHPVPDVVVDVPGPDGREVASVHIVPGYCGIGHDEFWIRVLGIDVIETTEDTLSSVDPVVDVWRLLLDTYNQLLRGELSAIPPSPP